MRFLFAVIVLWLWLWFVCIMVSFGFEITGDAVMISSGLVVAGTLACKS